MENHLLFEYFEQKTLIKSGLLFKSYLLNGLESDREYNFLSNNCLKEISDRIAIVFPNSNQELRSFLSLFKDRASYYSKNWDEHIFKNELFNKYKSSLIRKTLSYKELIFKLAVYNGLSRSYSIISKKKSFFELVYNKNEFKKFIFSLDFNSINKAEIKLRNKYYPKRGGDIINFNSDPDSNEKNKTKKVNDSIDLYGILFNINEFALYNREWKNFKKHKEVSFKDIYDKVMLDFNDPYNYIKNNRKYDGTPFYKSLQEDIPIDKKNFIVEVTYQKISNLAKKVSNDKFLKYIEEKKLSLVN